MQFFRHKFRYVDGLSELLVTSLDDLEKYYEQGNRARNIGMLGVKNECAKLVKWCGIVSYKH